MSDFCEAHWVRQAVKIPVFRVGLCEECFAGKPIRREETVETATEPCATFLGTHKRRLPRRHCVIRPPQEEQSSPQYLNIANALKFCRLALDVTQYELAARMDVPRPWVSKAENGVLNPTIELIERIAAAFGLPTWVLCRALRNQAV